ncbi:MAG: hypothetical protein Q7U54_08010 [Bacteroidales bacterium]|nr:hypothetical protein [Bacteroidales bacterium]
MKTQTLTYSYDPTARSLTIYIDGKPRGGFMGATAERKFNELLTSGAEISITAMNKEAFKKILIRNFHAALATQGILDHKESIVSGYGVESTTELNIDQLKELVAKYSTGERSKRADDPADIRTLRSDILTVLNKLGIYVTGNNWDAVNTYCLDKAGKLLYQMNKEELVKARKQFNSILDWQEKKNIEIRRKQQMN